MTALCFVDANVFVCSRDASEPAKQALARQWLEYLWENRCGRTGIQALNEYYVTVTRKLNPGLEPQEAWQDVEDLLAWDPVTVDAALMKRGVDISHRFTLSWWDSLIVAAAQTSGCRYLLTEDLQDGQDLDGMQILSPFRITPQDLAAETPVTHKRG